MKTKNKTANITKKNNGLMEAILAYDCKSLTSRCFVRTTGRKTPIAYRVSKDIPQNFLSGVISIIPTAKGITMLLSMACKAEKTPHNA